LDGKTAYFASDQKNVGKLEQSAFDSGRSVNGTDIYSFELYPAIRPQPVTYVKAKVRDANTQQDLIAEVDFVDLATGQTHTKSLTNEKGEFLVVLPIGKDYALNVAQQKYLFHSENFALAESNSLTEPYLLNIDLIPIQEKENNDSLIAKAKTVILKNVFFATGSADLLDASLTELNRLKNLLVENPNLNIQINGHTDNVGSDSANQTLSTNRAQAVYRFLIENGIAASRLRFKGFGESQPIATNDTEAGRQENRRTEFEAF
jgi:outer membrane protein OmpA-like peptidoglycan-associated protein